MIEKKQEVIMLKVKDWLWLISIVASGAVAQTGALWKVSNDLSISMQSLDARWTERTEILAREFRLEVKEVRDGIPPEWFRELVTENRNDIRRNSESIRQLTEHMGKHIKDCEE